MRKSVLGSFGASIVVSTQEARVVIAAIKSFSLSAKVISPLLADDTGEKPVITALPSPSTTPSTSLASWLTVIMLLRFGVLVIS